MINFFLQIFQSLLIIIKIIYKLTITNSGAYNVGLWLKLNGGHVDYYNDCYINCLLPRWKFTNLHFAITVFLTDHTLKSDTNIMKYGFYLFIYFETNITWPTWANGHCYDDAVNKHSVVVQ